MSELRMCQSSSRPGPDDLRVDPVSAEAPGCPVCGQPGKPVRQHTIKALLAVSLHTVTAVAYRFCPTVSCPVVYFAEDTRQIFATAQVRERVYQKEPTAADVWVCYCFQHTLGALRTTAAPAVIVADITHGIRAGHCACDLRNPQGSCCLGNVRAVLQGSGQPADDHAA